MTTDPGTAERDFIRYCRWLLLAYPGRFRRRHGPEIITTLLDDATPGQRRPRLGEAAHLFLSGLRQRFQLPAGRPITVIAAVLVALTMGAFGAAAGSWAAALTFAGLPDDAASVRLTQLAGGTSASAESSEPYHHASPWWHESVHTTTYFAGGWDAELARQRLARDGWSVSELVPRGGSALVAGSDITAPVKYPLRGYEFSARANGVTLLVTGYVNDIPGNAADKHADVSLQISTQRTPVFLPLVSASLLAGLVLGWLLSATVAYRLRRTALARRRTAAALSAVALLTLALPAVALYGNVMRAFRDRDEPYGAMTVHSAFTPGGYYPFGPEWTILALTIAGLLAAAASIVLAGPTAAPRTTERRVPG